jgi:hypothetical protein
MGGETSEGVNEIIKKPPPAGCNILLFHIQSIYEFLKDEKK